MAEPKVLIVRAPGTNCDQETAFAFATAGGAPELLHVNVLRKSPKLTRDYQILCIPGGFSYGDDVAAGRILGARFRNELADALHEFREAGKLILGICNGFQTLLKSGLLIEEDADAGPVATLGWNDSAKFEDRWSRLRTTASKCPFLEGIEDWELPVAHAEGKFVTRDAATLKSLEAAGQLVMRYAAPSDAGSDAASSADASEQVDYPFNPNGSQGNVAGVCDATGRILGMMPHPERYIDFTHHPCWTRRPRRESGDGLKLFENAVNYFR
ncbi:MAG: phosphoribosylformylglycinamidine synthase I [Planctomycetales bacterium]